MQTEHAKGRSIYAIANFILFAVFLGLAVLLIVMVMSQPSHGQELRVVFAKTQRDLQSVALHHEYKYQVGLLWSQRLEFTGEEVTTVLKLSDPMRPLLDDVLDIRLCGDVTSRFKSIEHNWMVLVMSRTSPRRSSDCRSVVALYQIRPSEEAPVLQ